MVKEQGTKAFSGPRIKAMLNDELGELARSYVLEVNLLSVVAGSGVCDELLSPRLSSDLRNKLVRRLASEQGHPQELAIWAVEMWADVLGVTTEGSAPVRGAARPGRGAPAPKHDPWPSIPGFRDFVEIGRGTSSVVFRAADTKHGRDVAIKVLSKDAGKGQFVLESRAIGMLGQHPNIVQVFDSGTAPDGSQYLVMQLYDGSLKERIDQQGPLPVEEAVGLVATIADAVQFAHSKKILHCDIKPANVLFSEHGPGLADFGVARSSEDGKQGSEGLTPLHAAPELILGDRPDARADVWSLGSTLYTALAASPPFQSSHRESLPAYLARLESAPVRPIPRTDVGHDLTRVINRCLAKDRADRYATAGEVAEALRRTLRTDERSAEPVSVARPAPVSYEVATEETIVRPPLPDASPPDRNGDSGEPQTSTNKNSILVAIGASVALLLVALVVVFVMNRGGPDPEPTPSISVVPTETPQDGPAIFPGPLNVDDQGEAVALSWIDRSEGSADFLLRYVGLDGTEEQVPVEGTSYEVRGLDPDVGYCFRIIAFGLDENGETITSYADAEVRGCELEDEASPS